MIGGRVYINKDVNINIFYTFEPKKCDEEHWIDKRILGWMGPHLDKMNEEFNFLELLKKWICAIWIIIIIIIILEGLYRCRT